MVTSVVVTPGCRLARCGKLPPAETFSCGPCRTWTAIEIQHANVHFITSRTENIIVIVIECHRVAWATDAMGYGHWHALWNLHGVAMGNDWESLRQASTPSSPGLPASCCKALSARCQGFPDIMGIGDICGTMWYSRVTVLDVLEFGRC